MIVLLSLTSRNDDRIRRCYGTPWVYLGRRLSGKRQVELLLGKDFFRSIAVRINDAADCLMTPYIEGVGKISSLQTNTANWLASKFASRGIWQTQFFHRLVMVYIGSELIASLPTKPGIIIVVEDPWVFEALRVSKDFALRAEFVGKARLSRFRVRNAFRAPAKRAGLAAYTVLSRLLVAVLYRYEGSHPKRPPVGDVALHAYIEPRTIDHNGEYHDVYMGKLGEIADRAGLRVVRFTSLYYPLALTRRVARNGAIWPLILSLSYASILKATFERWQPTGLDQLNIPGVAGEAMKVLLRAERISDSGAAFLSNCLAYAAYSSYMEQRAVQAVAYPFENQPWEKLLCWAARRQSVAPRLVGFQHSTVARMFIHFFRSRHEDERFFPDAILVGGEEFFRLLVAGGWDPERLCICGALRISEVFSDTASRTFRRTAQSGRNIIVALPVDTEVGREMLLSLQASFPDAGWRDGMSFCVRFHPAGEMTLRKEFAEWLSLVEIDRRPYLEALKDQSVCGVLYSMGASGLEALFMGVQVVRFRTTLGVDIDPLDRLSTDGLYVADEATVRQQLLELAGNPRTLNPEQNVALRLYFEPPNPDCVVRALT